MAEERTMQNDNQKLELKNPTVYQTNENCQVFTGPITGCVFAMPGAVVNQQASTPKDLEEEEQNVLKKLTPIFFGDEAEAGAFLTSIKGMKSTQITEMVNKLVDAKKISEMSRKRDLWQVLHDAGLYSRSETNWNMQVK